jgi:hypothetical protein
MVSGLIDRTTQLLLATTWAYLNRFFKDPTAREKALEYLYITKQGKNDFNKYV